ncbi:hypothetical protein [Ramlibacter agri]|nr:hypothetical protein [Ramlibacter agri]
MSAKHCPNCDAPFIGPFTRHPMNVARGSPASGESTDASDDDAGELTEKQKIAFDNFRRCVLAIPLLLVAGIGAFLLLVAGMIATSRMPLR